MERPSVYEAAGGEAGFRALVAAHHQRCLDDPELNHPFSHGGHPDHLQHLAGYLGEVFGGPPVYSQSHGGQSFMLAMHADQGMEDDLGPALRAVLRPGRRRRGAARRPRARGRTLKAYMEWAVADVYATTRPARPSPGPADAALVVGRPPGRPADSLTGCVRSAGLGVVVAHSISQHEF